MQSGLEIQKNVSKLRADSKAIPMADLLTYSYSQGGSPPGGGAKPQFGSPGFTLSLKKLEKQNTFSAPASPNHAPSPIFAGKRSKGQGFLAHRKKFINSTGRPC